MSGSGITAPLIPINCLLDSLLFCLYSLFIKVLCTVYLPRLNPAKDLRLSFTMSNEPLCNQLWIWHRKFLPLQNPLTKTSRTASNCQQAVESARFHNGSFQSLNTDESRGLFYLFLESIFRMFEILWFQRGYSKSFHWRTDLIHCTLARLFLTREIHLSCSEYKVFIWFKNL